MCGNNYAVFVGAGGHCAPWLVEWVVVVYGHNRKRAVKVDTNQWVNRNWFTAAQTVWNWLGRKYLIRLEKIYK